MRRLSSFRTQCDVVADPRARVSCPKSETARPLRGKGAMTDTEGPSEHVAPLVVAAMQLTMTDGPALHTTPPRSQAAPFPAIGCQVFWCLVPVWLRPSSHRCMPHPPGDTVVPGDPRKGRPLQVPPRGVNRCYCHSHASTASPASLTTSLRQRAALTVHGGVTITDIGRDVSLDSFGSTRCHPNARRAHAKGPCVRDKARSGSMARLGVATALRAVVKGVHSEGSTGRWVAGGALQVQTPVRRVRCCA
jgi:hypothetical protein